MKIIILTCLLTSALLAETKYLIINGGHSKSANRTTYYEQTKSAYDAIKSQGGDPVILNADGTWNSHDKPISDNDKPKIYSGINDIGDIKKAIDSMNLSASDDLVIYFTGHGDAPNSYSTDAEDPHRLSTYTLWNEGRVTWKEMGELLGRYNTSNLKLVTDVCNGGGVHYISQQLENTCSVSAVPFYMKSSSGVRKTGLFASAFWDKFKNGENLMSSAVNAFTHDMGNPGMGSLSSFDYIDYVLNSGQYEEENKFRNIDPKITYVSYINDRFNQDLTYFQDNYLNQTLSVNAQALHGDCYHCVTDSFSKMSQDIEGLVSNSNKISHEVVKNYFPEVFEFAQDFVSNKNKYQSKFEELNSEERALTSAYNKLVRSYSTSNLLVKWIVDYDDKKAELVKRKRALRAKIKEELGPLFVYSSMIKNLKNVDRFFEVATKEQKDKFLNILKCEHETF